MFFTFTAPQCRKLLKTGDSPLARDGNRRELPAGFQVASHSWLPPWKTGAVVALAALQAQGDACMAPAAAADSEGNCKEQPERHLSLSQREEAGWKKT